MGGLPMSIVVSAVTGPHGVIGEYQPETNIVGLKLKYKLTYGGAIHDQWIEYGQAPDADVSDLDPATNSEIADILTGMGYELP
jgi:hypothetical protein